MNIVELLQRNGLKINMNQLACNFRIRIGRSPLFGTLVWEKGVSLLKFYLLKTSWLRACSIKIFQEGKIYSTLFLIGLVSFLFDGRFSGISLYILLLYIAYLYPKCPVRCVTAPRHFKYLISCFSPSLSLLIFNLP